MRKVSVVLGLVAIMAVAGCNAKQEQQAFGTQGGRALVGAGAGLVAADLTGQNLVAGTALGALAGGASCNLGVGRKCN